MPKLTIFSYQLSHPSFNILARKYEEYLEVQNPKLIFGMYVAYPKLHSFEVTQLFSISHKYNIQIHTAYYK